MSTLGTNLRLEFVLICSTCSKDAISPIKCKECKMFHYCSEECVTSCSLPLLLQQDSIADRFNTFIYLRKDMRGYFILSDKMFRFCFRTFDSEKPVNIPEIPQSYMDYDQNNEVVLLTTASVWMLVRESKNKFSHLEKPAMLYICTICLRECINHPILCPNCHFMTYCSEACLRADENHYTSCKKKKRLEDKKLLYAAEDRNQAIREIAAKHLNSIKKISTVQGMILCDSRIIYFYTLTTINKSETFPEVLKKLAESITPDIGMTMMINYDNKDSVVRIIW